MCGIVGYVGSDRSAQEVLIDGLRRHVLLHRNGEPIGDQRTTDSGKCGLLDLLDGNVQFAFWEITGELHRDIRRFRL